MKKIHNLKDVPMLMPHNLDWHYFFNNDHAIDLEIGCGRPHFFFDRAYNYPQRNIVGIEWKYEFISQAQRRIEREHIQNAASFHGNAWLLVPLFFSPNSISTVFVNFPDPWWKARHKKRLLLNETFLDTLKTRTTADGCIVLQTDVLELFEFYKNLINTHGAFHHDETITNDDIIAYTKAKTHREKKCLDDGMTIYRAVFKK